MFAGARIARASPLGLIAPHPGASVIERLVTAAETVAERQVANHLTRGLLPAQAETLDAFLTTKEGTSLSVLTWARQPPGAPGHRALARLVEQRSTLSAIDIDPACAEGVHPLLIRPSLPCSSPAYRASSLESRGVCP